MVVSWSACQCKNPGDEKLHGHWPGCARLAALQRCYLEKADEDVQRCRGVGDQLAVDVLAVDEEVDRQIGVFVFVSLYLCMSLFQ